MGTPDFASQSLEALFELKCKVVGVVSQPDRPKGRGRALQRTPVAATADGHDVPVYQWPRLSQVSYDQLTALKPDLMVVVAYGKILPRRYLELPRYGCLNVHASILPKLRGAAPIQWAVLRGHGETGVSIMQMDEGMDTGDVLLLRTTEIGPDETSGELHDRLASLGAQALGEAIDGLCAGALIPVPQNHDDATEAPKLAKSDGRIDWQRSAQVVHNLVRGMSPWPCAYVEMPQGALKIHETRIAMDQNSEAHKPGEIIAHHPDGPVVSCLDDEAVVITKIQRPGKRAVSGAEFLRGTAMPLGTMLGDL